MLYVFSDPARRVVVVSAPGKRFDADEKITDLLYQCHRLVERGKSHVCEHDGRIVGVFYLDYGPHIEPTYEVIEDGAWIGDDTYGVVHRIASDGSVKGVGKACIEWALAQCGHLRIDTHGDNALMQGLLARLGFERCGIIHIEEDDYPRIAFEKISAEDR